MELEAAIFDFGGVVTTPILEAFSRFDDALGIEPGTTLQALREQRESDEPDFHRLEKGSMSESDYYDALRIRLEQICGHELAWPDDARGVRRHLVGSLKPNDRMLAAIEQIGSHYRVGMLTNNVREWAGWRKQYPMHLFEVVIDSCEVGMRKPDPSIYRLTCERLGVEPERALFVDDLPVNVHGATAVGMHGLVFTTTDEVLSQLAMYFPRAFEAAS